MFESECVTFRLFYDKIKPKLKERKVILHHLKASEDVKDAFLCQNNSEIKGTFTGF